MKVNGDRNASKNTFDKGNYKGYYKNRQNSEERLALFQKVWVEGKLCLDIGCNEGLVTVSIARKLHPRLIIGIDIDKRLIEGADSLLKRLIYENKKSLTIESSERSEKKNISSNSVLFRPRSN